MFDRVFVINLQRRPDRWEQFLARFPADWPFAPPEQWSAVDGTLCDVPAWFKAGAGAWGCLRSHLDIWRRQIECGWDSVLVLEDDAIFARNAVATMQETMTLVSGEWCQIYFGGQHLHTDTLPPETVIHDKLIRCRYVNRTHAYAIRLPFAAEASEYIDQPNDKPSQVQHVDYLLGDLHDFYCVFAPWRFCVGQARSTSDVRSRNGRPVAVVEHFWNQFPIVDVPAGVA